jgi:hypothetical protein
MIPETKLSITTLFLQYLHFVADVAAIGPFASLSVWLTKTSLSLNIESVIIRKGFIA